MREIELEDYEAVSQRAADLIAAELRRKPALLLCASAGNTPTGAYARLATLRSREPKRFDQLRVLQIDEWAGLERGSPATCRADLETKLRKPLRIDQDRFIGFRPGASDPGRECRRIARWLERNGPIDVCLLGLGANGHVAMIEPAEFLSPRAHVAALARSSQRHTMLAGLPRKPRSGMTLGIGDILNSRAILLLVSGRQKHEPLKRLLQPRITPRVPASFLWLHPRITVLYDRAAAAGLRSTSIKL